MTKKATLLAVRDMALAPAVSAAQIIRVGLGHFRREVMAELEKKVKRLACECDYLLCRCSSSLATSEIFTMPWLG